MCYLRDEELPLVSICCLAYNHEKFIADAIEGFLIQETDFKFEILIGEDCSRDRTEDVIREYQSKNPGRIRLIKNKSNMGGRENFRNLTQIANGKYIAICEGDDYWTDSKKLKKQVAFMEENTDCVMCFHSAKVVNSIKIPLGYKIRPFREKHICNIEEIIRIAGSKIPTQSKVFRKSMREDVPQWHFNAHVGDMASDLLYSTKGKIAYLDETMSVYRLAGKGSWTRKLYSGHDVLEKKIAMMKRDIALYEAFNEYTNYKYCQVIENVKSNIRCGICLISDSGIKMKKKYLSKLVDENGIYLASKMVVKFGLLILFARFQNSIHKLRKTVR